jgi:hypothetical protein
MLGNPNKDSVAGRLENPALVPGNLDVDQFAPVGLEPGDGLLLITAIRRE